ncbi:MAG: RsmF rRNA methyltransferase first C-terminal domain-containing protein [Anaerolineae bacterium]|uniref:RsmB/NOP family class I SAM-dependent RNA methyltransferase n=1 Tax=Promineifilum sp. TaxID=2664178 RepID=UPI002411E95B|nr:RsmB/NOP family class I SAM-dependent RNA methyltransferase [Promineifilum sp.]MCW5845616.1 RsmF rRNA methyltransferase first C-terminal domain-containing protein [Anaerolineae bacterium]
MKKSDKPVEPPAEFLARMRDLLGTEEYAAFRQAFEQPPRAGLRVNTLKISIPDFISIAPFSLAPVGRWEPAGFIVTDESRPGRHPYHDAGLYYLQEPSAMAAAALLSATPGERVLDLAAAPGGKATQLAALMAGSAPTAPASALRRALDEEGLLVANDVHAGRAHLLADNLARWGAVNVLVTQDEPQHLGSAFGPVFDRVLIDAPCSGEGMIRRRESLEWSEAIVAACARRQRGILAVAPDLLRPGGRLLYSTCTFAPEENEQVVADFLAERPDFQLMDALRSDEFGRGRPEWAVAPPDIAGQLSRAVRLWPHRFAGEGHFLALMERQPIEGNAVEDAGRARLRPPSAEEMGLWREFADASLVVGIPDERLHAHNGRLYLRPKTDLPAGRVRLVRYGLLLGEVRPGRFHPAHDLALALTVADAAQSVDRPPAHPQLAAYLSGAGLPETGPDGWVLMAVDGFGLGWGKRVGGRIKNHYPHYLRRR